MVSLFNKSKKDVVEEVARVNFRKEDKVPSLSPPAMTDKEKLFAMNVIERREDYKKSLVDVMSAIGDFGNCPYVLEYTRINRKALPFDQQYLVTDRLPYACLVALKCPDGIIRFGYSALAPEDYKNFLVRKKALRIVASASAYMAGDERPILPNSVAKRYNKKFQQRVISYFNLKKGDEDKIVWPITNYSERIPSLEREEAYA